MKIAFLSSIYPAHAEKIYLENPKLFQKSSDEQIEFIRWHALSSFVRWNELLENQGFQTSGFNLNLPEVALAWAKENNFETKASDNILEIGLERIRQFKPDIVFSLAPLNYLKNNFLNELIGSLSKKPKLIAWYGANAGEEEIFRYFDLTLSNSKHLVNSLKKKDIQADFLQHSFDPIVLDKIKIPKERINRGAFFGNLELTADFRKRTNFLEKVSIKTRLLDVHATVKVPTFTERFKYFGIKSRYLTSKKINPIISTNRLSKWADPKILPPSPWNLSKKFIRGIKEPCYGKSMLESLASYDFAINYHNKHTGNYACNMRLFESTGLGCTLLTDYKNDLNDYFEIGTEILSYKSADEACEKIEYLYKNPSLSRKISYAGQKKCLECFNTQNQIKILSDILTNL